MRGHLRPGVLVAIAATALAACGDGGSSDDGDFKADADAICTEAAQTQTDIAVEYGPSPSPEDALSQVAEVRDSGESALSQLEQLTPPDDLGSDWDAYLGNRRDSNAAIQRRADATEQEDAAAAQAAGSELDELLAERDAIGEKLGLEACARNLPEADEEQVMAAVELASTSADGAQVCSEAVSARFLEQQFDGDVDRCARAQREAQNSDSVTFESVIGVAEVLASADVTLVGGELDGSRATLDLVFEDGSYRVLRVSMAAVGRG